VSAQEVRLLAAGDIEWSRMLRGTNSYSLQSDNAVEMEVMGVRRPTAFPGIPLLNVPANRPRISQLLGRDPLDSPTGHPVISIDYGLRFDSIEEDTRYPFQRIRDVIQSADVAFANLEMPLSNRTRTTGAFTGREEFADALAWAGMDVVSTANNHAFDGESLGVLDTTEALRRAGVGWVGTGRDLEEARRPYIIEKNGIRIAFLGYAVTANGGPVAFAGPDKPGLVPMDIFIIREDIERVRDQADFVAVSLHWAIENARQTHPEARRFAYELVDLGADIVLGHHPHQPRGVEIYNGKVIFYSLGNFIFGHNHEYWIDGYLARLTLTPERITQVEILPIAALENDMSQPYLLTGARAREALEGVQRRTADLDTQMEIVGDIGIIRVVPARRAGESAPERRRPEAARPDPRAKDASGRQR
jgi:poly-gamma-glutamate synthesis protein (capsule biosynthesis protein)